jgi:hypothetical protein
VAVSSKNSEYDFVDNVAIYVLIGIGNIWGRISNNNHTAPGNAPLIHGRYIQWHCEMFDFGNGTLPEGTKCGQAGESKLVHSINRFASSTFACHVV